MSLIEIERKYLVKSDEYKLESYSCLRIKQGYLSSVPERTVRVRITGDKAYITIKGIANVSGLSRFEWEKEIEVSEAEELLKLCELGIIDKTRYFFKYENHIFEIDEFYAANQGLIIAEVELASEDEEISRPSWLGQEVTGDKRYYNASLTKNPYNSWKSM